MVYLTAAAVDLVNISIPNAAIVALLGYAVVFFGLILLMTVITILGKIFIARDKKMAQQAAATMAAVAASTPAPINEEIRAQILGGEKPIEGRYADSLAPVVESTREKLGDLAKSDEDVLSYIAFPNLAEKFLEERKAKEENACTYSIVEA